MKKTAIFLLSLLTTIFIVVGVLKQFKPEPSPTEDPVLNVYNWYNTIDKATIEQFEKEFNIKVRLDLYDSNEMVEAKLLAGNSGYDIVFPSLIPFAARGIKTGLYKKLDHEQIPNFENLDKSITKHAQTIDKDFNYIVPFYWGSIGIAYVKEKVDSILPDMKKDSWALLFDPEIVSKLSPYGVTLLLEAIDVYASVYKFLDFPIDNQSYENLVEATQYLHKIRPYITRFSSARFVDEIAGGQTIMAHAWSGETVQAQKRIEETKLKLTIEYIVPKEGSSIWFDCIAIPADAPHPNNAHKFINFLLRPEISAQITNHTMMNTCNKNAAPLIDKDLLSNKIIFPSQDILQRLTLDPYVDIGFDRIRQRLWAQVQFQQRNGIVSLFSHDEFKNLARLVDPDNHGQEDDKLSPSPGPIEPVKDQPKTTK